MNLNRRSFTATSIFLGFHRVGTLTNNTKTALLIETKTKLAENKFESPNCVPISFFQLGTLDSQNVL